ALMEKTLCNINMDMVGEWLSRNQAFFCLMRTTYGNPHYINDVMENYYRYLGEGGRERIQNRSTPFRVPVRVVAPTGADEPFAYSIETHYGASDHEVFNDWGVGVPGVMMIAWPDTWYHTSGDTADKADPTQLKRAAIIGAAGAYTVAAADADMAARIAGETVSNGTRRLGHQLVVGLETLNRADTGSFAEAYKTARWTIEAAVINEKDTLDSLLELAPGDAALAGHIGRLKQAVQAAGDAQSAALEIHADAAARRLGVKRGTIVLSDLEKRAARSVPRPTARVRESGYREYQKLINDIPLAERAKYPVAGKDLALASANELQLLIDGRRSVLDIKKMLDAQYERKSTVQAIFNHIEILKLAGLVEMR
ncbi:MAG: M28 family peptidase, partial [Candidatus Aminicenantes bacterium]